MKTGREIALERTPEQLRAARLRHWENSIRYAIDGADERDIPAIAALTVDQCIESAMFDIKQMLALRDNA